MDGRLLTGLLALCLAFAGSVRADGPTPLELGQTALTRSTNASRRVARMLDGARRVGDVQRTWCLDDALNRIDSQVRLIAERVERIRRAEEAHDELTATREGRLLGYVLHQLPQTEHLADTCIGVVANQTTVEAVMPAETD